MSIEEINEFVRSLGFTAWPAVVLFWITVIGSVFRSVQWLLSLKKLPKYSKLIALFDLSIADFEKFLSKNHLKTVRLDTYLDFSIGTKLNVKMSEAAAVLDLPSNDQEINGRRLPLLRQRPDGEFECLDTFIIHAKHPERLKFSAGGTGVCQVLLRGEFDVEMRAHSGPSVEYTLWERRP